MQEPCKRFPNMSIFIYGLVNCARCRGLETLAGTSSYTQAGSHMQLPLQRPKCMRPCFGPHILLLPVLEPLHLCAAQLMTVSELAHDSEVMTVRSALV